MKEIKDIKTKRNIYFNFNISDSFEIHDLDNILKTFEDCSQFHFVDLGCGKGALTNKIKENANQVIGIDIGLILLLKMMVIGIIGWYLVMYPTHQVVHYM